MPTKTRTRSAEGAAVKAAMEAATAAEAQAAILRADSLAGEPWLVHGFSTRLHPGASRGATLPRRDFTLGAGEGVDASQVERNRKQFLRALMGPAGVGAKRGVARQSAEQLITVRQIHSDIIHVARRVPAAPPAGDGIITNVRGLLLGIKTADCVPVLVADPERRVVGAFHAGWRGTLARIVEKGIGAMRREFGSREAQLKVAIGPAIHACCYQVSEELRDKFDSQFDYAAALFVEKFDVDPVRRKYPLLFMNARAPGHAEVSRQLHLDLIEANRRQLLAAGVREENFSIVPLCTACRTDLLFSHRAEQGKAGRMMAVIGIRAEKTP